MTSEEAAPFYTIGVGDGSWGAFFALSSLWVIRTVLFGYATDHKLVYGLENPTGAPEYMRSWKDSRNQAVAGPAYIGIESVANCLFYKPTTSCVAEHDNTSLFQAVTTKDSNVELFTRTTVDGLSKHGSNQVQVDAGDLTNVYDHVIVTAPTWAMQLDQKATGEFDFPFKEFPIAVRRAIKSTHTIASCKVFVGLKHDFWTKGKADGIPQLVATDTYLQGMYAYRVPPDAGVLLVSYTWEDDALKTISFADEPEAFTKQCVDRLDAILKQATGNSIKPYIDETKAAQVRWVMVPTNRGCSKIYRAHTELENMRIVAYNQNYSNLSHLYFAGES